MPHVSLRLQDAETVVLSLFGHTGGNYAIQVSDDLVEWRTVQEGVQPEADLEWQEQTSGSQQFFRVVWD